MKIIDQSYQISLLGNYEEIIPNPENLKFFWDRFWVKGLIPNTHYEINLELGDNPILNTIARSNPRIRLSSGDSSLNFSILSTKIDFSLANIDLDSFKMTDFDAFIEKCKDFIQIINERFPNKHRLIRIIRDFLLSGHDEVIQKKFSKNVPFFEKKPLQEWKYTLSVRDQVANFEDLNLTSTIKKINNTVLNNTKKIDFEGFHLRIDVNTISENEAYRFDGSNINNSIDSMVNRLAKACSETFNYIVSDE